MMYDIKDDNRPDMRRFYTIWPKIEKLFKPLLRGPEDKKKMDVLFYVVRNVFAYLFFRGERYARISMYFEHENGEKQHKAIFFGEPSDSTPERFKDGNDYGGGATT